MKHLILVRHAKSDGGNPELDDIDRPLNERGKKDAPAMARRLLPGSLVAGLFGMNAGPVPFAGTGGGFWLAAALGLLATLVFVWLLRRAGFRFD